MSVNSLATGCGICLTAVVAIASIAGIVVSSVGLGGGMSLQSASAGGLTTSILSFNVPGFITNIIGLAGAASIPVVCGVSLAGSLVMLMVAGVAAVVCVAAR